MKARTVRLRHERQAVMSLRCPGFQVVRNPADIFHQYCRILEHTLINTLQDEAGCVRTYGGINDKRVIDVAAAVGFHGIELASQFEIE